MIRPAGGCHGQAAWAPAGTICCQQGPDFAQLPLSSSLCADSLKSCLSTKVAFIARHIQYVRKDVF
jgi:hypothetical protein